MRRAIPPFPNTPSWRGAHLKHRDKFTFTFKNCHELHAIEVNEVPVLQPSTTPWRRIGGVELYLYAFLTSALYVGEWSASHPGRFTPTERALGTHCIRSWVGPRAGLDAVTKRKIPSPCRDSTHLARNPELYTELSRPPHAVNWGSYTSLSSITQIWRTWMFVRWALNKCQAVSDITWTQTVVLLLRVVTNILKMYPFDYGNWVTVSCQEKYFTLMS
jgi:hypothetical protein